MNYLTCLTSDNMGALQFDIRKFLEATVDIYKPLQSFYETDNYFRKLDALRKFYRHNERRILSRPDKYFDSYPVDWDEIFTPIELDGKDFHKPERDLIRDIDLRNAGWRVYRITGTEMSRTRYKDYSDFYDDEYEDPKTLEAIEHWIMNTGDGIIEAVANIHFREIDDNWLYELCTRSLICHTLTD